MCSFTAIPLPTRARRASARAYAVERSPTRPYQRSLPFLLFGNARSIFAITSAGSAPSARRRKMNSTTSSRRSPRSIFETTLCVISRPKRLRRPASSTCVTPAPSRSATRPRRNDVYSSLNGDLTMSTLRLRSNRSVGKSDFTIVQIRLFFRDA